MTEIVIRPAEPADAEAIAAAYVETWRATYPGMLPDHVLVRMSKAAQAQHWSRLLGSSGGYEFVYVAMAGQELAGFGSAGPERRGEELHGEIYTLYVRPDWQNHGIGRHLICALLQGLALHGCTEAMLWVVAANPSRFFYEAMGGVRTWQRTERLWGMDVAQYGYRWPDIAATLREGGPCARG